MEIAFLVVYGALVALVMPYVIGKNERVGALVPAAISVGWGALLWGILTWVGMPYNEGWIWVITMFTMPVVHILSSRELERRRLVSEEQLERSLLAAPAGSQPQGATVYEVEEAKESKLSKVRLPKLSLAKKNKDDDEFVA